MLHQKWKPDVYETPGSGAPFVPLVFRFSALSGIRGFYRCIFGVGILVQPFHCSGLPKWSLSSDESSFTCSLSEIRTTLITDRCWQRRQFELLIKLWRLYRLFWINLNMGQLSCGAAGCGARVLPLRCPQDTWTLCLPPVSVSRRGQPSLRPLTDPQDSFV